MCTSYKTFYKVVMQREQNVKNFNTGYISSFKNVRHARKSKRTISTPERSRRKQDPDPRPDPGLLLLVETISVRWNIVSGLCITRNRSPCLLRWSCLQTSEGQRRSEFHLVGLENSETPSTSSVWPSDHREDYRSCARPFYSLVQIIPKALHSD